MIWIDPLGRQVRDDYRHLMNNSVVRGWLNEFNVRHDFSSPVHLRGLVVDVARLSRTVEAAGVECRTALQVRLSKSNEIHRNPSKSIEIHRFFLPF